MCVEGILIILIGWLFIQNEIGVIAVSIILISYESCDTNNHYFDYHHTAYNSWHSLFFFIATNTTDNIYFAIPKF